MKRFGSIVVAMIVAGAGCRSKPAPPPPPFALTDADRIAREAARLLAQENWPGAALWWQKAGERYRLLNRLDLLAMARHNEGVARRALGEVEPARKLWEDAARLNLQLGRKSEWWRDQLSLFQLDLDIDLARADVRRETLVGHEADLASDPTLAAHWLAENARWHSAHGQFAEAVAAATKAVERFQTVNDASGVASAWCTVGRASGGAGQWAEATRAWTRALAGFESMGHPRGIAVALAGLGGALRREGRAAEGREFLGRARDNYRALKLEAEARRVEEELGVEGVRGAGR